MLKEAKRIPEEILGKVSIAVSISLSGVIQNLKGRGEASGFQNLLSLSVYMEKYHLNLDLVLICFPTLPEIHYVSQESFVFPERRSMIPVGNTPGFAS